ncbi:MAG: penicillin-binding protein [Bacteroidetes bacterium]|nr:MAG: penicillin-binding protein [Bacteroidota bacterium]
MLKNKKWIKRILIFLIGGASLLALAIVLFYYSVSLGFFGKLYSKDELKAFKNEMASQVYSEDDVLIGKFFDKDRINVSYEQIPPHLIHALIATEDARYFEHEGVDFRSLLRVLFKSIILRDRHAGGGSTITQQLLKNMYGRKNFGPITMLVVKNKEIILAQRLESVYSKEEILTLYLNTVPFGENIYGIGSAAQRFYGKKVSELTLDESSVLVGMLKANTYYNPRLHPDHAKHRQGVVLRQMQKAGYITEERLQAVYKRPLKLNYGNLTKDGIANYYLVQVRREARDILEEVNKHYAKQWDIEKDGLIIKTTLNYDLQKDAMQAFHDHLKVMQARLDKQYQDGQYANQLQAVAIKELRKRNRYTVRDSITKQYVFDWDGIRADSISIMDSVKRSLTLLHAGMIALAPKTGAVRIWVGGIDFYTQPYDQVKAKKQLASTFKPILYAAALETGKMPCDYLSNEEIVLSDYNNWSPQNYDHTEGGKYSLAAALAHSKNIPTVHLFIETGYEEVNYLWKKMGFSSILENEPSSALGTVTASLKELATAYSSFANGGYAINSYTIDLITSAKGDTLYRKMPMEEKEVIISAKTSMLMNGILQKAINEGTGTAIRNTYKVHLPLAGKTGTSQNFANAWFVAYNPSLIVATRVGANYSSIHFSNGSNGSGGRLALPLVGKTLAQAQENPKLEDEIDQDFSSLPIELEGAFDCEDFKEETAAQKVLGVFKSKNTSLEKEQKKAQRKKKRLLRRKKRKG